MDASQFIMSVGKLGSRYFTEYMRNVERYTQLVSGVTQQAPPSFISNNEQDRYMEFMRVEIPKVSSALVKASLTYYTTVFNTGIETANRFFEQVILSKAPQPSPPPENKPLPTLLFHGKYGDWSSNAFLISNHRDQPIEVTFEVTDMLSDDGATRFRPTAKFVPESCQLAPHSEQTIQCSVLLTEEFRAGQIHRAQIRGRGFPEMAITISVHAGFVA